MKQVRFTAFGVPHEVAACVEVADVGAPGPDEVVIEVLAFPINPADLLTITGGYAVRPQPAGDARRRGRRPDHAVGADVRQLARRRPGDQPRRATTGASSAGCRRRRC